MTATRHVCVYKIIYINDNKFEQFARKKIGDTYKTNKQTTTPALLKNTSIDKLNII